MEVKKIEDIERDVGRVVIELANNGDLTAAVALSQLDHYHDKDRLRLEIVGQLSQHLPPEAAKWN